MARCNWHRLHDSRFSSSVFVLIGHQAKNHAVHDIWYLSCPPTKRNTLAMRFNDLCCGLSGNHRLIFNMLLLCRQK
eukprot:4844327-Amphidinium_carterae.1